jgi:hypothetical protein
MAVDQGLPASGELVMDDLLPMTVEQRAEWFGSLMFASQVCRHSCRSVMALGLQDLAMEQFSHAPLSDVETRRREIRDYGRLMQAREENERRKTNPLRHGMPEDEGMCPFP